MKQFAILASGMEAQLQVQMLKAHGIDALVNGSREYASIITGNDSGRYEIMVAEADFEKANEILAIQIQPDSTLAEEDNLPQSRNHLKKSFVFAISGLIILPILFNAVSIYYLYKYLVSEENSHSKRLWGVVLVLINFGGLYMFYFYFNSALLSFF